MNDIASIQQTIDRVLEPYGILPEGGDQIVKEVTQALEQRDDTIVELLSERAVDMGLHPTPIADALREVGLIRETPAPYSPLPEAEGIVKAVAEIDEQLAQIKRVLGI